MADTPRYIEVIASASASRTVETYYAIIELTVETRKKRSCLDISIGLRDRVLSALVDAGIPSEKIEEGGGRLTQGRWAPSKRVVHELRISHKEMSVLVQAMAKVEHVFTAERQPWFSGIHKTFTFSVPTPKFAEEHHAAEQALKKAVQTARSKALALAQEARHELDGILSISEESPQRRTRPTRFNDEQFDSMMFGVERAYDVDISQDYTPAAPRPDSGRTYFRVRFAVQEGA